MSMKYRSKTDKIPMRLINECSFCHARGLKPGILEVEYPHDVRTREYFNSIAGEMMLDANGFCTECANVLSRGAGRNVQ